MKRALPVLCLLALVVGLPLALRKKTETAPPAEADDTLVILTPHSESIRREFGEAFAAHWKAKTGRTVYLDWRSPGGTSEIRMVLDAGFKAAAQTGREGMGVDVFFGGGEPDFAAQERAGRFERLEVFGRHPEWFGANGPVPETFGGERFYSAAHAWTGVCLSQFGICYNPAKTSVLGVPAPASWNDLGDPRYAGQVALSDPTKSGSVARAFELVVQSEIQRSLEKGGLPRDGAIARGWDAGLRLIQRMAANARYFTDSGSRIPQEVAEGNAAAGMCIDFFGRTYEEWSRAADGTPHLSWDPPRGGTTLNADPVAVLKGAPHPDVAQDFVEFCLAMEGQTLWFNRPGTPGGPRERALHRLPIRSDCYVPERLRDSTMPAANPYHDTSLLIYDPALTGRAFNTLRRIVRAMCMDPHDELKTAWRELIRAGLPPDAMAVFGDVSAVSYGIAGHGDAALDSPDPLVAEKRATELANRFRENYRKAARMAE